jgi:hypothetical protein
MDPTNDWCNKLQLRTSGKQWIKLIQLHQITPSANSKAVALIPIWYHPIHRRTCCHVTREHMQYNFMLDNSYISHLCTCFHRLPGHWPTGHCRTSSLTVIPPSLQRQHITPKTQVHLHVVVTLHTDPYLTLHTNMLYRLLSHHSHHRSRLSCWHLAVAAHAPKDPQQDTKVSQ